MYLLLFLSELATNFTPYITFVMSILYPVSKQPNPVPTQANPVPAQFNPGPV